jgi:hypothetical protein
MTEQNKFDPIVRTSSSDAFALIVHQDDSSTWEDFAAVIAGQPRVAVRSLAITSSDGEVTVRLPYDEFISQNHSEPSITISADWAVSNVMDGYVTGTGKRERGMTVELYEYGMLDELKSTFVDLLFARFRNLVQQKSRVLAGVDASGLSGEEEWLRLYNGNGDVPPSASIIAFSKGEFAIRTTRPCEISHGNGAEFLFFQY